MQGVDIVEGSWKHVLLGKEKGGQEDDTAHYVLLIRLMVSTRVSVLQFYWLLICRSRRFRNSCNSLLQVLVVGEFSYRLESNGHPC